MGFDTGPERINYEAQFARDVAVALHEARVLGPSIHSSHEGYAVILEGLRDLEREVFKQSLDRDNHTIHERLVQIAVTAQRVSEDLRLRMRRIGEPVSD